MSVNLSSGVSIVVSWGQIRPKSWKIGFLEFGTIRENIIKLSFRQKCFVTFKMRQIHFRPWLCPGPRWRSLRHCPRPPKWPGWGYLHICHPIRRLWRLVLQGACDASPWAPATLYYFNHWQQIHELRQATISPTITIIKSRIKLIFQTFQVFFLRTSYCFCQRQRSQAESQFKWSSV